MTVFHAVPAEAVVTVNEEQFVAYTLHNFDIEAMIATFGTQTPMFFTAMNRFCQNFRINFKHSFFLYSL